MVQDEVTLPVPDSFVQAAQQDCEGVKNTIKEGLATSLGYPPDKVTITKTEPEICGQASSLLQVSRSRDAGLKVDYGIKYNASDTPAEALQEHLEEKIRTTAQSPELLQSALKEKFKEAAKESPVLAAIAKDAEDMPAPTIRGEPEPVPAYPPTTRVLISFVVHPRTLPEFAQVTERVQQLAEAERTPDHEFLVHTMQTKLTSALSLEPDENQIVIPDGTISEVPDAVPEVATQAQLMHEAVMPLSIADTWLCHKAAQRRQLQTWEPAPGTDDQVPVEPVVGNDDQVPVEPVAATSELGLSSRDWVELDGRLSTVSL